MDICSLVSHLVTIVWCREDSDTFAVVRNLVALWLHLVAPDDVIQFVLLQEPFGDVRAKLATDPTLTDRPPILRLWIRPEQVAHWTRVWWLSIPVYLPDVIEGDTIFAEETSVHNQNFTVNTLS